MSHTTALLTNIKNIIGIGKLVGSHLYLDLGEPYICTGIFIDRVHSGRYYIGYSIVPWYGLLRPGQGKAFSATYSSRLNGGARVFAADKLNPRASYEIVAALIEQNLLPDLTMSYKPRNFLEAFFLSQPDAYLEAPYLRLRHLADYMMTAFLAREEKLVSECAEVLVRFDPNLPFAPEAIELANTFLQFLGHNDEALQDVIERRVACYKASMNFVESNPILLPVSQQKSRTKLE